MLFDKEIFAKTVVVKVPETGRAISIARAFQH